MARHAMTVPGDRVGVAVSGGSDSLSLLFILRELAPDLGLQLSVLHVNHRLRPEADQEASFVRAIAERLRLEFHSTEIAPGELAGNVEHNARQARYAFFERMVNEAKYVRVATGHTVDDQAETVLTRLLRGSGTRGLSGIWPVVSRGNQAGRHEWVIRPLLNMRRGQLREWLRERGETWCEDPSNRSRERLRNRIRHELIPALVRDYNPALVEVLAETAEVARVEEEYWGSETAAVSQHLWRDCTDLGPRRKVADLRTLAALPLALRRRVLRAGIEYVKGDLHSVDFGHLNQVLECAEAEMASAEARSRKREFAFAGVRIQVSAKQIVIDKLHE